MTRLLSFPPVVGEWNTRAHAAVKSVDLLPVVAVCAHLPTGPAMARARTHADATTGHYYRGVTMGSATVTVELHAAGTVIGTIDVPIKLSAGKPVDGFVPLIPDTADLADRITRGAEAFAAAVEK